MLNLNIASPALDLIKLVSKQRGIITYSFLGTLLYSHIWLVKFNPIKFFMKKIKCLV